MIALLLCRLRTHLFGCSEGFSEEWIAQTFAIASEGNGLLAVLAGIVAQLTADAVGEIGPFRLAVVVTAVAMAFIIPWEENFGSHSESPSTASDKKVRTNISTTPWPLSVFAVGLCYSLFEGAMYVFGTYTLCLSRT
jgi:MFS transporter, MFS domain-containing protein family, molybdate-anion transporter